MFNARRRLNLALQGGGAHGAFTWGALDRLLQCDDIELGWISGTSAGAVNAVALASGQLSGGADGARDALARVWQAIEAGGSPDISRLNPFLYGMTKASGLSSMAAFASPYDFNPLGIDPLRQLLTQHIDFEGIRQKRGPELLIAATEVGTGQARLFRRADMRVEVVLASACLPQIHHAVEIDGRAFWDGGFSANPDLVTLASESPVQDTLLIQLSALDHPALPRTAQEISARTNSITFNLPLLRDVGLIAAAQAEPRWSFFTFRQGRLARLGDHRLHVIHGGRHTSAFGAHSKAIPERKMLEQLFDAGRAGAAQWLQDNLRHVGRRQTIDLRPYLDLPAATARDGQETGADSSVNEEPRL